MTHFEIKTLPSGYWFVRLDPYRFAQWRIGERLTLADCFGWWDQGTVRAINRQLEGIYDTRRHYSHGERMWLAVDIRPAR